jgi:hypothetical protein
VTTTEHPYVSYPVEPEEIPPVIQALLDARPTFQVGDVVRITPTLECDYCHYRPGHEAPTEDLDEGRLALVVAVDPDVPHDPSGCFCNSKQPDIDEDDPEGREARHAHRFWVLFMESMPHDDPNLDGADFDTHFAATELELLEGKPSQEVS